MLSMTQHAEALARTQFAAYCAEHGSSAGDEYDVWDQYVRALRSDHHLGEQLEVNLSDYANIGQADMHFAAFDNQYSNLIATYGWPVAKEVEEGE